MRVKETQIEDRWAPEPELPPSDVDAAPPNGPEPTLLRYCVLGLTPADAALLVETPGLGSYFEAALASLAARGPALARRLCGWTCVALLDRETAVGATLADTKVRPAALAKLVRMLADDEVSAPSAERVLDLLVVEGGDPEVIAAREGLVLEKDDAAVVAAIAGVLQAHPQQVAQYRAGKAALWLFFMGQVMRAMRGRAASRRVHKLLVAALLSAPSGDEAI